MKTEFKVSGMHCPSCPKLIAMNVEEVNGVKGVSADEKAGTVEVSYDEKKAKVKDIISKIETDGYKVINFKEKN